MSTLNRPCGPGGPCSPSSPCGPLAPMARITACGRPVGWAGAGVGAGAEELGGSLSPVCVRLDCQTLT